jgi:alpha-L-rhamnosidase
VRVWDRDGNEAAAVRPAFWEAGLLAPSDWRGARWITVEQAPEREQTATGLQGAAWLWSDDANAGGAPAGTRYFRRTFTLPVGASVQSARIVLTVDDQFTLFVNGKQAGKSSGQTDAWRQPQVIDLKPHLIAGGANVLAVAAQNTGGQAGLIGRLVVTFADGRAPMVFATSGEGWQASKTAPSSNDWQTATADFDQTGWTPARVVAPFGGEPWGRVNVGGPQTGPGRYLRRAFVVRKPVKQARLYATALGIYEPYVNGRRVGNDVFAPGWTEYKKRVYYQTYDVTGQVRQGANALGLILSDGWYAGHVGLAGRGVYGSTPLARCLLIVQYADGTSEWLGTDPTWRGTTDGAIVKTDLLMGETYDAQRETPGWSTPAFRRRPMAARGPARRGRTNILVEANAARPCASRRSYPPNRYAAQAGRVGL